MTNKLALAVAVVLGVLSILGIKAYVDKMREEFLLRQELMPVMVAAHDVPEGQIFSADDIEVASYPRQFLADTLRYTWINESDRQSIIGAYTRTTIKAGQVLQTVHFHRRKDESERLKFDKEQRALTVPISKTGGLAGMLRPGDYVDLAMSLTITRSNGRAETLTWTVLKGTLILATDNVTDPFSLGAAGYSTLTFRLTPNEANKLLYCLSQGGQLVCLLRQPNATDSSRRDVYNSDKLYKEVANELR